MHNLNYDSLQKRWSTYRSASLTREHLTALFNNEIPCIIVPGVASADECQQFEAAIEAVGFAEYQNVNPPIGRIGITQFEANKSNKNWYFSKVAAAGKTLDAVAQRSFDPLARVMQLLREVSKSGRVERATEPFFGRYFAGLVRRINASALIHADFAPFDAPGWSVGEVCEQLAWNIYLRTPTVGGDCIVYNRQWSSDAEAFRIPSSYGYRPSLVAEAESKVIKPQVGDLVLFNSRNFHEVMLGSGDRLSVSSFVGRKADHSLVLWS